MAVYLYQCYRCGHKLELTMRIKDYKPDNEPICESCGKERMKRVVENAHFHIVGGRKKGKHND